MEIKLEIGMNLRGAIEEMISHGDSTYIQEAFGINFMKLIKEHAESGDVKLEVKGNPILDYEQLNCILAPLIGVEPGNISNEVLATLIIIGKGIFWSKKFQKKAEQLEKELIEEFKNISKI